MKFSLRIDDVLCCVSVSAQFTPFSKPSTHKFASSYSTPQTLQYSVFVSVQFAPFSKPSTHTSCLLRLDGTLLEGSCTPRNAFGSHNQLPYTGQCPVGRVSSVDISSTRLGIHIFCPLRQNCALLSWLCSQLSTHTIFLSGLDRALVIEPAVSISQP